jgi:hypothetical protein
VLTDLLLVQSIAGPPDVTDRRAAGGIDRRLHARTPATDRRADAVPDTCA